MDERKRMRVRKSMRLVGPLWLLMMVISLGSFSVLGWWALIPTVATVGPFIYFGRKTAGSSDINAPAGSYYTRKPVETENAAKGSRISTGRIAFLILAGVLAVVSAVSHNAGRIAMGFVNRQISELTSASGELNLRCRDVVRDEFGLDPTEYPKFVSACEDVAKERTLPPHFTRNDVRRAFNAAAE